MWSRFLYVKNRLKQLGITLLLFSLLGCNGKIRKYNEYKNSIGRYKVNLEVSDVCLNISDSIKLSNIELFLFKDKTYRFSESNQVLGDSTGSWKIEGYAEVINIKLIGYNNSSVQFSTCCGPYNEISTSISNSFSCNEQFGRIRFIKIEQ
jgi:hypothetical protein